MMTKKIQLIVLSSVACAPVAAQVPSYSVRVLDTPAGFQLVSASAIDNAGTVVGLGLRDLSEGGKFAALRWNPDGTVDDLGALANFEYSEAADINATGVIAATAARSRVDPGHAFVIDTAAKPVAVKLEPFSPRVDLQNSAVGINDLGVVVGSAHTGNEGVFDATNPFVVATLWDPSGAITVLGSFGDVSFSVDVNNSNQVLGRSSTPISTFASGFLWDASNGMRLLNGFDGSPDYGAVALDINDAGVYVGLSSPDPFAPEASAAVWFTEAQATALSTLPNVFHSEAIAINEHSDIVGRLLFNDDSTKAVIWGGGGGTPQILNELVGIPALDIVTVHDINDSGQILITAFDQSGSAAVFVPAVLTPIS